MPLQPTEIPFSLALGFDSYNPAISGQELKLQSLINLEPRYGRLFTSKKQELLQTINEGGSLTKGWQVCSFPRYQLTTSPAIQLYAVTAHDIYPFNTSTSQFGSSVYNFDSHSANRVYPSLDPMAYQAWGDSCYMSRLNCPILKGNGASVSKPSLNYTYPLSGRYMIISNRHLMLGNVLETGSTPESFPLRVRYSDLNNAEDWEVDPLTKESDSFDLDENAGFITGLSNQRGYTYIYAYDSIWRARYVPGRIIGTALAPFIFEPVFTGLGNIFHYAQIQVKMVDFFIGADGFYMLDGTNLESIGDDVWKYFQETNQTQTTGDSVYAHSNIQNNEVYWLYKSSLGSAGYWSVVYNFKEKKWSTRDPQNMFASYQPAIRPKTYLSIDDFSLVDYGVIDTFTGKKLGGALVPPGTPATTFIDGNWQYSVVPYSSIFGKSNVLDQSKPEFYTVSNKHANFDDTEMFCKLETFEMDLQSTYKVKELISAKITYKQFGKPNLYLVISSRKNQAEDLQDSDPIQMDNQLEGESIFDFRSLAVDKYVKFSFYWYNSDTAYIDEIYKLSLKVMTPITDVQEQ